MKCFEKFTNDEKKIIFEKLYIGFGTKNEQDVYLQSLLEVREVARRRKRKEQGKDRTHSFIHYALKGSVKIKICLNAYLSLHAVSVKRVKRLKKLLIDNLTPQDKRGKNLKSHVIPELDNIRIRQHISSYPV